MRGRFLSSSEQAALDRFPTDIDPDDLTSCFTLTDENHEQIIARRYGPGGRWHASTVKVILDRLGTLGDGPSRMSAAAGSSAVALKARLT